MKNLLIALLLMLSPLATASENLVLIEAEKSSVYLRMKSGHGMGSGVVVKADNTGTYVLTNQHVCETLYLEDRQGPDFDSGYFVQVTKGKHHDTKYLYQVVKTSDALDLCLVHSFKKGLKAVELAREEAKLEERVCNLGNPDKQKGIFRCGPTSKYQEIEGEILRIVRIPIWNGSSGSGVFNKKGQLIGLISQRFNNGASGAYVPLTHVKLFLGDLIE